MTATSCAALPPLPVVAVHGFNYDPADVGGANDPRPWFEDMAGLLDREVLGFAWYSCPVGFRLARPVYSTLQTARAFAAAWLRGKLHPYRDAWSRAEVEAKRLAAFIAEQPTPVDLVAHSLGTRVALLALPLVRSRVRRVVFFNGAELIRHAGERAASSSPANFLNLVVTGDQVLGLLGSRFSGEADAPCIGRAGLDVPPVNWRDLVLDDPGTRDRARRFYGWTIRGNDPADPWDHGESYRFAGNVDPVRAFLAGQALELLVRKGPPPIAANVEQLQPRVRSK